MTAIGLLGRKSKLFRIAVWMSGLTALLVLLVWAAFQLSPWPAALMIRWAFDKDGTRVADALKSHVPPGIASRLNLRYDPADKDALLDVHYPARIDGTDTALTTVVWVHGGGWVSGSKDQIANYARILAGQGFTVVAVDYSIAPGSTYPKPLKQVNAALEYLEKNATQLHVDASRIVLAGDSAGSQIAAQLATAISSPDYAHTVGVTPAIARSQLSGMLLYCGAYDMAAADFDGPFRGFLNTVLWSYSGHRDFKVNPAFAPASVVNYMDGSFPPTFISAGNDDPLEPQSKELASTLAKHGVRVDTLFFPPGYVPALPHEYQFSLDTEAGRTALARSAAFLKTLPAVSENR